MSKVAAIAGANLPSQARRLLTGLQLTRARINAVLHSPSGRPAIQLAMCHSVMSLFVRMMHMSGQAAKIKHLMACVCVMSICAGQCATAAILNAGLYCWCCKPHNLVIMLRDTGISSCSGGQIFAAV